MRPLLSASSSVSFSRGSDESIAPLQLFAQLRVTVARDLESYNTQATTRRRRRNLGQMSVASLIGNEDEEVIRDFHCAAFAPGLECFPAASVRTGIMERKSGRRERGIIHKSSLAVLLLLLLLALEGSCARVCKYARLGGGRTRDIVRAGIILLARVIERYEIVCCSYRRDRPLY